MRTRSRVVPAQLAVDGGPPVRDSARPWPAWPVPAADAEDLLRTVLHSRRWAISSPYQGELFERRFAEMFATYTGVRHCVPTDHGSSALVIALEALGLGAGERVLVPALTWTATATAVLRAALVPVLVDTDPETGCVTPDTLAEADDRAGAGAVIVVHWACRMADMPAIDAFAQQRGIAVVEDAAQAHGARMRGQRAGSLGRLGCFSMQHSKVLTCGEGGAVTTGDSTLVERLEELRADSRRYRDDPRPGELELAETATVQGANFCLSEFSAALLCAQLPLLDAQHEARARSYAALAAGIADVPGVRLLAPHPDQDGLSIYELPVLFGPPIAADNGSIAAALTAELGLRAYTPRTPLHRSPLLRPWTKPSLAPLAEDFARLHAGRRFPGAEEMAARAVLLHHSALLDESDVGDIVTAVTKVARRWSREP